MAISDTFKDLTPGQKKALQIGGAGAGIFVAYMWMRSRSNAAAAAAAPPATGTAATDGFGTDIPSGAGGIDPIGSAASSTTVGDVITDNAEWYAAGLDALIAAGWDSQAAATALGAYLDHQPLTATQQTMVRVALGAAGKPPVGVFNIVGAPTPVPGAARPGTPGGLRTLSLSDTAFALAWSGVSGATSYRVYGAPGGTRTASGTSASFTGLRASTKYGPMSVSAVSGAGEGNRSGGIVVTTKATPKAKGAPAPKAPAKAPANRYPKRWKSVVNGAGSRRGGYSYLASKYHLGISGLDLYKYQFSAQAHRPSSTLATLRKRGPNKIFAAGSTVLPYPK